TGPLARAIAAIPDEPSTPAELEASFTPDPGIHDGRFANNPWLLELPRPITHLTWDNAALVSPATARRLGLETEDVVDLELEGRRVRAPVMVVQGHADGAVTLHLGWGKRGAGFDAYALRGARAPSF